MKKVLFGAALLVAAVCFTACNKDEAKCWKVTYEVGENTVTTYQWASQNEIEAAYDKYDGVSYKTQNLGQTDCALKNVGLTTDK